MSRAKAMRAVMRKELLDFRRDPNTFMPMFIFPVVFALVVPLSIILSYKDSKLGEHINDLLGMMHGGPHFFDDTTLNGLAIFFNMLLMPIFLFIPIIVVVSISIVAFAGEKENRTLEGLLFTPASNRDLIGGKLAASTCMAVAFGWVSILLFVAVVLIGGHAVYGVWLLDIPRWIMLAIFVLPLVSLGASMLCVWVSLKAKTTKSANSMSIIVVIPVLSMFFTQVTGAVNFGVVGMLILTLVLALLDAIGIALLSRFDREKLLAWY
ncbi:MAG: ABC transporter permease subunit [Corynebacterium sp.]|nr:ABC transporter permease subunit [Corynebacterium sp.]